MSSPTTETEVIVNTESGLLSTAPEEQHVVDGGEEMNKPDFGSVLAIPASPDGTKDTNVSAVSHFSAVTFADSAGRGTTTTETTAGRKINRNDVRQIFHNSTTTGTISMEQIVRIKKMHDKISEGVNWDFNYSCLLMVASIVAGLGLALDSSTTVISSMLLSPIMGPVVGMSYGLIIWDLPLIKRSARNEGISIVICVIFGLILGACCQWTQMAEDWPTQEMLSRGTRATFLAGFPIAFFSGLGVALSVLDDQTSSLVGVAISASLLPPAVNCGMLFIVAAITGDSWDKFNFVESPDLQNALNELAGEYNFAQMGVISLLLTVANVVMVAIGATLMFRVKETLPVKKKIFWDDLKIARRLYQGRALDSVTGQALNPEECAKILSERSEA